MATPARFLAVSIFGLLGVVASSLRAQTAPANPNFEEGPPGSAPSSWMIRAPAGYRVIVVDSGAFQGRQAVLLQGSKDARATANIIQLLDVAAVRGQRVRWRAFVRAELAGPFAWSGLWLRVDRPDMQSAVLDTARDRSVDSSGWRMYEVTRDVAEDATAVVYGAVLSGEGRMWVDSVTIEVLPPANAADLPPPSPSAIAYLDAALGIMEAYSINRIRVDWPALRARARARIAGAQRPANTYAAIRLALAELGDHHSHFLEPRASAERASGGAAWPDSNARLVDERFGYVRIPGYAGGEAEAMRTFARQMQDAIRTLDRPSTCGWIVDLRGSTGGNMWPMLAGIGPVLGEGVAGSFVTPGGGNPVRWAYRGGAVIAGDIVQLAVPRAPYRLRRPGSPVAVLTGGSTASSGEAIAISFRGLPNARSFGAATGGFSSTNRNYSLPDSATIVLTIALDADRTGVVHGGPVPPDEPVANEPGRDAILAAAVRWLDTRCRR
jgi:carboxyl-terminal processing protease